MGKKGKCYKSTVIKSAYSVITIKKTNGKIEKYKVATKAIPETQKPRIRKGIVHKYVNKEHIAKKLVTKKYDEITTKHVRMNCYVIHNTDFWEIISPVEKKTHLLHGNLINKNILITNGKRTVSGKVIDVVNVGGGTTTPPPEGGLPPIDE